MVATDCLICGTPLVDAKSVEIGIGPTCRKRHGYDVSIPEAARKRANEIIHALACEAFPEDLFERIRELRELGLEKLAEVITDRKVVIRLEDKGEKIAVKTPYAPNFVNRVRQIQGRNWDSLNKVWMVPQAKRGALYAAMRDCYPGGLGVQGVEPFSISQLPEVADEADPEAAKSELAIQLNQVNGRLLVHTPYNGQFIGLVRQIPGRKWESNQKAWSVPASAKPSVVRALDAAFHTYTLQEVA